ncbi:unnamed protein product [Rotaria sordida]|uniref:EGF-like domain-containing protein n=1 Tax=Rotaria sordida TaxID=392033 RepID=A0A815F463_9BILA|nr:unnamed protein product [Rotaria sordida]
MPCCDFNETVEKYIRKFIIGYFGYTYIKEVQLGSIIQQMIVITQNGFNISNQVWMKDVAKELFSIQMKLNRTQIYDKMLMNISDKYSTKSNVTIIGGNISIKSFNNWYKSVSDNPIFVKFIVLIKLAVDRYLSNPVYCYNQCTDTIHGTCIDSGYFQFGICQCKSTWTGFDCATPIRSNNTKNLKTGLNTGFYLKLNASICIVNGFQFTTATSHPKRDPIMVTLEGSNANKSLLTLGNSWTLMYNGSSGLESVPGRGKTGVLQMFNNNQPYRSYRLLVVLKRGVESGVHYSEFAFYGHSCLPGKNNEGIGLLLFHFSIKIFAIDTF